MKFVKFVNVNEYLGRIITYPYKTRQQFAFPEALWNSGSKMIKCSAIEISSKIPSEMKNITCLALLPQSIRNMYYSATRNILCVLIGALKPGALIKLF